jgi:shikimate dehydrogenase
MDHYGLIGNPVSHSLSEKYFTDKFTLGNIDARFERFLLKDIHALPQILDAYPSLQGLSVTSPFKESVISYCDSLDTIASRVRAVNTLAISRNEGKSFVEGYNTDVHGFAAAMLHVLGARRPDALILGSGGAARAVAYALSRLGIRYVVISRNAREGVIQYSDIDSALVRSHKLIINATPLGMVKYIDEAPNIPYHFLGSEHILYDLIYNPTETPFLLRGKERKALTVNGMMMLQVQAEKAWKIWTA